MTASIATAAVRAASRAASPPAVRASSLPAAAATSTTTQLAQRTGLSLGTVSQHLAVLRDA
ncbi:ArsR family transcriptional regulator, partial [Actinomadura roseirufa]|uniref:ArsR family transcriptional regulator n=1 Tax=Actinomadura roseirufa TaxID=2094049 RepID=UPI001A955A7C